MSRLYSGVTRLQIKKSLHRVDILKSCHRCIHYSDYGYWYDVWRVPRCMAAPCEPIITWNEYTHACDCWHDGEEVKKIIKLYEH